MLGSDWPEVSEMVIVSKEPKSDPIVWDSDKQETKTTGQNEATTTQQTKCT